MEVGPDAKAICDELLRMGVIVRPLGWMGFPEAMRIFGGNGGRERQVFVGHGAGDPEARRRRRTRRAMRVMLQEVKEIKEVNEVKEKRAPRYESTHSWWGGDRRGGDADPITKILREYKTIAVVGLSSNPMRPSFGVTEYMQSAGGTGLFR